MENMEYFMDVQNTLIVKEREGSNINMVRGSCTKKQRGGLERSLRGHEEVFKKKLYCYDKAERNYVEEQKFITEYDVYHDESQESGYWHGMLLVPKSSRETMLNHLKRCREVADYYCPISLKGLKSKQNHFRCVKMWIQTGFYSLMQDLKGRLYNVYDCKRLYCKNEKRLSTDFQEIVTLKKPLRAKFIIFRERDSHQVMDSSWFPDHASKVETTFRMGLKGGLHLLFDEEKPATIASLHFDGHEHHRRRIDRERIIGRLKVGLRDYCKFHTQILIDDRTGNHTKSISQEYDDCQFLQLTDLLVGAFRTILGEVKNKVQKEVSLPVKELVRKWEEGPARMKKSRWHKGFCISECYLENGQWVFNNIIKRNTDILQLTLI